MDRILAGMKKLYGRRGDKTTVRRLQRRDAGRFSMYINDDAAKYINDDAASSSSFSDLSVSTYSFMTPSMELPERTSFRNFEGEDGVMARLYKSDEFLPDDLAISFDVREASKKLNRLNSFELDVPLQDLSEAGPSAVNNTTELTRSEIVVKRGLELATTITVKSVLKPPPAKRPPLDHQGSSWDFLTLFAPESEIVRRPSSLLLHTMKRNHINNDAASSSSSSNEDLSVSADSLMTPSMEFPDRTSFRNFGGEETLEEEVERSTITWQKGELLGRGVFGSVYEGISTGGDFFAVKEVSLLEQGREPHVQECIQQLEGEIALLSQLQHQNIVSYRGTAKDGSNLYIFLELVSQGSLSELYRRYQLRDSVVQGYTRQILDGLNYLHDKDIVHRDIKCDNILVDASGAVKLADFGLAKVSKLNDIKACKGTPFWMAPEVINPMLNNGNGYGKSADIWSLGCTVLEMLTSRIPYSDIEKNPVHALFMIAKGVLPDIPDTLSLDARDFILKCLKKNPKERRTAAELLNHPFVRRPLSSSGSGSGSLLGIGIGSAP